MNILIIGCGRVGISLAERLDAHGHDVAIVDSDVDNFRALSDEFTGITVCGMPMDMQVMQNAGIENCDAVAVVTPDDNLNITVSQVVKKFFGVENVLARISDPAREKVFKKFGLKTVCPTNLAGDAMFVALTQPFDNKNMTLPLGMNLSTNILIDLSKLDIEEKKSRELNKLQFEDDEDDFSKIIIKNINLNEIK